MPPKVPSKVGRTAKQEGVRRFGRVASVGAVVREQGAAKTYEVGTVGGADLEARGGGRDSGAVAAAASGRFLLDLELALEDQQALLLVLDFLPQTGSAFAGALWVDCGADCASAVPANGSSAAIDAPAAARLIFTLVLLVVCATRPRGVGRWGLCRQSRAGDGAVTPQVELVIPI
jgi:hypothetical protein